MDAILELLGLTMNQAILFGVVGVVLVVGWFMLRSAIRLAMLPFRIGCAAIAILLIGYLIFQALGGM
jgi:hypothetical protein